MERGEVPPYWDDLCLLSAESATDESIDLTLEWMSGQQIDVDEDGDLIPIQDKISNPFGIVSDQYDTEADKLHVDFSNGIRTTLGTASEGERDHSSLVEDFGKATTVQSSPSPPREERVGIKVNLLSDFDAKATEIGESNPSDSLLMPQRVNLHEVGLRRLKRIAEQKSKVNH
jgi:hypothetical protein